MYQNLGFGENFADYRVVHDLGLRCFDGVYSECGIL